jgi:hypothetical protein
MKYLREFLETAPLTTDKTDRSPPDPLLSALSVPHGSVSEIRDPDNRAAEGAAAPSEQCAECRRAAWLSLVAIDGTRTCVDCLTGRTAMRAGGVPVA